MSKRRWLLLLLFLVGLSRYGLYYSGLPFNQWVLGPLTHTFTFSSSLSEAKLIKFNMQNEPSEFPLFMSEWSRESNFGQFVGRAKIAALIGFMRHQNANAQIIRLRKWYYCDSQTKSIQLLERRKASDNFNELFQLNCD